MRRTLCLAAAVLVAGSAWSAPAYAKKIALNGEFVQESGGVLVPTGVNPDPGDPYVDATFAASTATLTGTWTGQNVASGTARISLETGEGTCTYDEVFTGSSENVGSGTVSSRGTCTLGPADPETGAQEFRAEARLVGGTGDFVGSRGRITFVGTLIGGVGSGTYSGQWSLPNSRRHADSEQDSSSVPGSPSEVDVDEVEKTVESVLGD